MNILGLTPCPTLCINELTFELAIVFLPRYVFVM